MARRDVVLSPMTPLRYPNDKPKAASILLPHVPRHVDEIISLFLTGGSLELDVSSRDINVRAITHNIELYRFWVCVAHDPARVALMANELSALLDDEEIFVQIQERRNSQHDPFVSAAMFYVLNRSAIGGLISCGKYMENHPLFNDRALEHLANFKLQNFIVSHSDDYIDAANYFEDKFLICCPFSKYSSRIHSATPVPLEESRIDHVKLRKMLMGRKNWLLLYELNDEVFDAYAGYEYKLYNEYSRETEDFDKAKEILIFANNL